MGFPSAKYLTGIVQDIQPDRTYIGRDEMLSTDQCDGEEFTFDVISRNKGLATFRNPESDAGVVKTMGIREVTGTLHTLKDKKIVSKRLNRLMRAAGSLSRERFEALLVRELEDLNDIHERTWEKLIWDMLRTGIVTVTDENGIVKTYDFKLANKSTVANAWNIPASSTPLTDLQGVNEVLRQSGQAGAQCFMSSKALRFAMRSDDSLKLLDKSTTDKYARDGMVDMLSQLNIRIMDHGYDDGTKFVPYLSDNDTDGNIAIIKTDGPVGVFMEGQPIDGEADEGVRGRFAKVTAGHNDSKIPFLLQEWFAIPGLTMPDNLYALKLWA